MMINYEETYIFFEGHVWEIADAVIIDNAGHFVGKCSKAEYVGNRFILNLVDYVGWRVVG